MAQSPATRVDPGVVPLHRDTPAVLIDGKLYRGWQTMRVTRGIDRQCTDFDLKSAPVGGVDADPFAPCEIRFGDDLVLTGYVDANFSALDGRSHSIRIAGRSKTQDLVDCTPEIPGGEFRGAKLDAIARAICQPFGIEVVVQANVGEAFDIATFETNDTAFEFLERQARLRAVLLTDDAEGRLVLAQTGEARAEGTLRSGVNVLRAQATLNVTKRHRIYVVQSQRGSEAGYEVRNQQGERQPPGGGAQPGIYAEAIDAAVPRYRRHVTRAEAALTLAEARERAAWQARYFGARSAEAVITVQGWRQDDGSLWAVNQRVAVEVPELRLEREMLISVVSFLLGPEGRTTALTVGPPEGFTPDPGQVRRRGGADGGGLRYRVEVAR